jgi:hypothetical protein
LIDRAGVYSKGNIDVWGEAYIDATGRNDSVASATAIFSTNKYFPAPSTTDSMVGATNHNPDSFTNPDNAFDDNDATYANYGTGYLNSVYLGRIAAGNVTPGNVYVKLTGTNSAGNASNGTTCYLEGYNGSTWVNIATIMAKVSGSAAAYSYTGTTVVPTAYSGIRVRFDFDTTSGSANGTALLYTLEVFRYDEDGTITHTIPTGTFASNISKSIGIPMIEDYEDGIDVQYKLSNGTDDSGYLAYGTVSSFTAFASEPTTLIVKLAPKSSSPTPGYPAIKGFSVIEL